VVMAPPKVANPKSSAKYYRKNAKARAKKKAYDTEYHSSPSRVKYRTELKRERVKRGVNGKGGKDMSHTKGGRIVAESSSRNRARNRGRK
jgi:hypothetical protein